MDLWNRAKTKIYRQPANGRNAEEYYKRLEQKKDRDPYEEVIHRLKQREKAIKEAAGD